MASRSDVRYANVPIEPEVFLPLGLDPAEAGVPQIRAALRRYGAALNASRRRLSRVFDRDEWNLMADVMNGCLDLHDYAETSLSISAMLMANVQDGHGLDRVGHKWFGEGKGDVRVEALIRKLVKLTPIEADAVGVAIREFWGRPEIDASVEEWWLPGGEKRPKAKAGR